MYLIITRLFNKRPYLTTVLVVFILFWVIYGMRVIYDIEIRELAFMNYSKYYVYSWAFGCSFIPALAVFFNADLINVRRLSRNLLLILIVANICITSGLLYFSPYSLLGILESRSDLLIEIGGKQINLINSISISFYGELLLLSSIVFLITYFKVISKKFIVLICVAYPVGIFNLLAGASRGSMLSFIFLLLVIVTFSVVFGLQRLLQKGNLAVSLIRSFVFFTSILILLLFFLIYSIQKSNFTILRRMKELSQLQLTGINYDRIYMWKSAWQQFKEHPMMGDSFVNRVGQTYSHNIILESLMATGLLGTIPFLFYLAMPFYLFYRLTRRRKKHLLIIFILFIAAFLLSMTSGGLFTVPEFWILSMLVIGLCSIPKNSNLTHNQLTT